MRLKAIEDFLEARERNRKKNNLGREYDLKYGKVLKRFLFFPKNLCREVRWLETAYIYSTYEYDKDYGDNILVPNDLIEREFVNEDAYWWYVIKREEYIGAYLCGQNTNDDERFDWREWWIKAE